MEKIVWDQSQYSLEEQLRECVTNKDNEEITELVKRSYPIDVAVAFKELEENEVAYIMAQLAYEQLASVLEQADEDIQEEMMSLVDDDYFIRLCPHMAKDNVVDILGDLPPNRRKHILNLMKHGEKKIISDLLGYDDSTAGGIMTTEYIVVRGNKTAKETIDKIKEIGPKTEDIDYIYVIDERKKVIGMVSLRSILLADNDTKISDIMQENFVAVEPETDQEDVSRIVSKYDLHVIPVVNKKGGLLGIITVDDIIDVIQEEHTEDMLQLGGVSKEESANSSFLESIQFRLPWLVINLATAFFASYIVSIFDGTIEAVVALAVAMPIVTGMGGNAGTQTLSIIVRGIALGEVELKGSLPLLMKEIGLGIVNGAVTGIITGVIMYQMYDSWYLGVIIFASMIGNMVIAGIAGFLVPLILKAFHADPAVASSIFVTTATDSFGFFIFLGLAKLFLPYLL